MDDQKNINTKPTNTINTLDTTNKDEPETETDVRGQQVGGEKRGEQKRREEERNKNNMTDLLPTTTDS